MRAVQQHSKRLSFSFTFGRRLMSTSCMGDRSHEDYVDGEGMENSSGHDCKGVYSSKATAPVDTVVSPTQSHDASASMVNSAKVTESFYRRPLPATHCVAFRSVCETTESRQNSARSRSQELSLVCCSVSVLWKAGAFSRRLWSRYVIENWTLLWMTSWD